MKLSATFVSLSLLVLAPLASAATPSRRPFSAQDVNLWKLEAREKALAASRGAQTSPPYSEFPAQFFTQPIDHADPSRGTFKQRYWVNTRHYVPGSGGPVIDRLPFLDTGIVEILANATGGVGVILEHRYYVGLTEFTDRRDRWLNNDQATADSANFLANVKFEGIDEDLTAPNTPWIYYGGSYAGARAAHMKVLYPELVFGAISSSGVTHAAISNWEYYDIIRKAADPLCSAHIENAMQTIDALLEVPYLKPLVKGLFGLQDLEHDDDFASVIEGPLGAWQAKNWDPEVGSTRFDDFCEALSKPIVGASHMAALPVGHEDRLLTLWNEHKIDFSILNYAQWIKENSVKRCIDAEATIEECYGTYDDDKFIDTSLDQTWRLWTFQVCTEWAYFFTAPPDPEYPRIVSKLMTMDYATKICRQAYPPGKFFAVPSMPNVTAVNSLGDFAIAADRLAIIDGEVDPWRPCTPHSDYAEDREDTLLQPFKLIPDAVHHYDEYGLRDLSAEPEEIQKIHYEMIAFVLEWLKDFKAWNERQ
ncbi:peptidase S28 [Melanogaster broomeanus]|nr:peptidase S28 [Melanogaster broomeanus]